MEYWVAMPGMILLLLIWLCRYHLARNRQITADHLNLEDPEDFKIAYLAYHYIKFANACFGWGGLVTLNLVSCPHF